MEACIINYTFSVVLICYGTFYVDGTRDLAFGIYYVSAELLEW